MPRRLRRNDGPQHRLRRKAVGAADILQLAREPVPVYRAKMEQARSQGQADTVQGERAPGHQPRYLQIYAVLRERIVEGRYAIGSNLPTEVELATEFGVSRYTVREALRGLVEQGMLARRQGSGSQVLSVEPSHGFVHTIRSMADLFQYALDTYLDIRSTTEITVGQDLAPLIGGDTGSRWLLIKGVRRTDRGGEAICFTHSYIPKRLEWIRPEIPSCIGPFYALLEKRTNEPIIDAVQEITAEPMTAEIAKGLGAHRGDYALRLLRRYSSRKGTLIASFNWHDARDFTYRMQLQRSRQK
jgi:GntR family transcriptional regulator